MKTSQEYFPTHFYLYTLIITVFVLSIVTSSSPRTEADALVRWKNTISSYSDDLLASWSSNNTQNHCQWTGISCNTGGSVSEIDTSRLNLSGTIHQLDFTLFQNLTSFNLSWNFFRGSIPSSIGTLSRLTFIDLNHNLLEGNIPLEIGNLIRLQYLNLNTNNLNGSIPSSIGELSKLISFDLSNNMLNNVIPAEIGNLTELQYLSFYNNYFNGTVPYQFGNLQKVWYMDFGANFFTSPDWSRIPGFPLLTYLSFSQNKLSRGFPDFIPLCRNLTFLKLEANNFSGRIPDSVFNNLTHLKYLNLGTNSFQGHLSGNLTSLSELVFLDLANNNIEDSFPFSLEKLPELRILILKSNRFHGTILPTKATQPFPKLQVLDISKNEFSGNLPINYFKSFKAMIDLNENATDTINLYRETTNLIVKGYEYQLVRILSTFTTIDLSCNKFHGDIPLSIGRLNSLRYLNFSHNILSGRIPPSLGSITKLESLDLSSNKFIGQIPRELVNLKALAFLNLSHNFLDGPVPPFIGQFGTFDNNAYIGNSGLCGFPLLNKCIEEREQPPFKMFPHERDESHSIFDGTTWVIVLMGYGSGTLVGIVLCHFIFVYERPKWFVEFVFKVFFKIKANSKR